MLAAASLAALLQNGDFSQGLEAWRFHHEGGSGRDPVARVESGAAGGPARELVIESHGARAGGVMQTIHAAPGSLWRLTAQSMAEGAAGVILVDTPSGEIGKAQIDPGSIAWTGREVMFRVPSPGEAEIHLDTAAPNGASISGALRFGDLRLEQVAEPDPGEILIHLDSPGKRPVDSKQGGQFIEYLCRLVPSMLAQQVDNGDFEEEAPYRFHYKEQTDRPHRPWYPGGATQVAEYSFETERPFNGKRSQKIVIHIPRAHAGIAQDGYSIKARLGYRLRLYWRGDGGVRGRAVLRDTSGLLAEASLAGISSEWKPADVTLRASRGSANATLALEFEGPGAVWLDRIYLIGEDAVLGLWRPDVVHALEELRPGVIRFGGTTVESYEWEQTIGAWDSRVPFTTYWGGLEPNFAGLDEFVQLCRRVGAEPLICLRWTGKTPADAAAEVEYLNGAMGTHWGSARARNGHREPYHVKYWQIGNEVGGAEYTRSIAGFARAMREVDPTIKLISSYPSRLTLELAGDWLDYLAPHDYDFGDLTDVAKRFDAFREQIHTQGQGRDIRVAVTEWNTTGGQFGLKRGMLQTLGNALSCARYRNLIQRNADLVEMAIRSNLIDSFGSGVFVTGPGWIYLAPTYYTDQLYQRAAGSFPLTVERESKLPWQLREPDVSAVLSADKKMLRLYAVNSTDAALNPSFRFDGSANAPVEMKTTVLRDREAVPDSEAMNSPGDPLRVTIHPQAARPAARLFRLKLAPYSLTLVEIRLQGDAAAAKTP